MIISSQYHVGRQDCQCVKFQFLVIPDFGKNRGRQLTKKVGIGIGDDESGTTFFIRPDPVPDSEKNRFFGIGDGIEDGIGDVSRTRFSNRIESNKIRIESNRIENRDPKNRGRLNFESFPTRPRSRSGTRILHTGPTDFGGWVYNLAFVRPGKDLKTA